MNMRSIVIALCAGALALAAACGTSSSDIPNPNADDYAHQAAMEAAHPGMDCVMEWVNPGEYMTNCYPMSYHPPYSVRVYYPKGCTCPTVASRPNNYRAPHPVTVVQHTTVVHSH